MATNSTEEYVPSESVLIFACFIIIFMILLAIVGNTLTIISFIRDERLRTTYNMYLVNLAFADFMIGAFSMPIYLVYTIRGSKWADGYNFCKVFTVIDYLLCSVTVILMIVISYDRLMLVKEGVRYYIDQSSKVAIAKIMISWIVAFLLYGPAIIGWDHWTGVNTVKDDDCDVQFAHDYVFTTTTAFLEFLLPLICLGVLNTLVVIEIRKLCLHALHDMDLTSDQNHSVFSIIEENTKKMENSRSIFTRIRTQLTLTLSKENNEKSKNRSTKKAQKAARSLALLVVAFIVTWAPYTILTVAISFCGSCVSNPVYETFTWILWFKSALNPFLYAFNSARFRRNFVFFICCGKQYTLQKHSK